jgi:hypothetical protein
VRYEIQPLGSWTDPVTADRRSSCIFSASWQSTLDLLAYEARHLGAELLVLQVDVAEADVRRDGMLRARAKVGFPGVVVSFESHHGPLRYATDAYEPRYSGDMPGWQANVRAIALALQALRAVDRYGVTGRGEQYVGWKALPAGDGGEFASVEEAISWMLRTGAEHGLLVEDLVPRIVYRRLARKLHPDVAGDSAAWHQLDAARQMLEQAGWGEGR